MSPDRKWYWDGARWQPVPTQRSAFGSGFTACMGIGCAVVVVLFVAFVILDAVVTGGGR